MGGSNNYLYEQAKQLSVNELGQTLVVAPHPDDESLGCGGTITLLRKAGFPVHVVFISDGSKSHPASKKYSAQKLAQLRESEAINALQILGVDKAGIRFMRLPDSAVPAIGQPGFRKAIVDLTEILQAVQPVTIVIPWRRDPHKDHRATWQIVAAALSSSHFPVRVFEYFVWLWERSGPQDLPLLNEVILWQVNIEAVIAVKQQAIMAHTSQVTNLIDDDPNGFILSPEVLSHFSGNQELFAEATITNIKA